MNISRMLLGEADGQNLSLDTQELNHHLFIIGGKDRKKPQAILKNAIESQIRSGSGLIFLQMETSESKKDLINAVQRSGRSTDYMEVFNKQLNDVPKLIESACFQSKIIYIELHKTTQEFKEQTLKGLIQMGEQLYLANSVNTRCKNHLMVVADQIDKYMHEEWMHLSVFSRRNNVCLVMAVDGLNSLINNGESSIHKSYYNLLNNIEHKFLFFQNDTAQNLIASKFLKLPEIQAEFNFRNILRMQLGKKMLMDTLTSNQFIYLNKDDLYVLDLHD